MRSMTPAEASFGQEGTLSRRLHRRVVVLGAIAILGLAIAIAISLAGTLVRVEHELEEAGMTALHAFDFHLLEIKSDLLATSESLSQTDDPSGVLRQMLARRPTLFELLLIEADGTVRLQRHRVGRPDLTAVAGQPWLQTVRTGGFYLGPVDFGAFSVPTVDLAVAVADRLGVFTGTLVARLDLTTLWNIAVGIRLGGTGYAYIADQAGRLVAYRNLHLLHSRIPMQELVGATPQAIADGRLHVYTGLNDRLVVASGLPLELAPWFAVVEQPLAEALGPFLLQSLVLLLALILAGLLVYGIVRFTHREIMVPLRVLREGVERLRHGHLENRIDIRSDDEFGELSATFNDMAAQLQRTLGDLERRLAEQKKADQELQKARNYLNSIIDFMPSILTGVTPDGRVTLWNREAELATGLPARQAGGRPLGEVLPQLKDERDFVRRCITERSPRKREKVITPTDGETRYWDMTVYPLVTDGIEGVVIRLDDVTTRVRLEEMMVQTEKMVSVGGLAAGLAHEINNPLSSIIQSAQNILRRLSAELPKNVEVAQAIGIDLERLRLYLEQRGIIRFLEAIRDTGTRTSTIVANMLSFSRSGEGQARPTDIHALLDSSVELAANDYELKKRFDFRRIEIVREYASDISPVVCEPIKIEQVTLNLLRNAAQAMARIQERPRITLRTRMEPGGQWIRIEVEDNGPGMDENTRKRVFEPFFTTKEVGVGTGLGLSVSYFIITDNHRGTLRVESAPGRGAKFIIGLPVAGRS